MDNTAGIRSQIKLEHTPATQKRKRSSAQRIWDRERSKTRVNIGVAFPRWRALKADKQLQFDADVALFLLDAYEKGFAVSTPSKPTCVPEPGPALSKLCESASDRYLCTKSGGQPEQQNLKRSSSTETCESVNYEYPIMCSASEGSVQSSEDEQFQFYLKELDNNDAWRGRGLTEETTKLTQNKENTDVKAEEDSEFRTSLTVEDGRYVVDLGSSSEYIVDEECILQLFRSCRECNRLCAVRKRVKGLQLVVDQTCCFCQRRCKWTNLPSDDDARDDSDFQINGKDEAHGENNTAM